MSDLSNIAKLTQGETKLISGENVYGKKGVGGMAEFTDEPQADVVAIGQSWEKCNPARELGQKWKVRPCIHLAPQIETTIADIQEPGTIQHIWITVSSKHWRELIIKMYWDGQDHPSVAVPLGDFFCNGWGNAVNVFALPINVNTKGGFNSYFPMPFRKSARIAIENLNHEEVKHFFYAITYNNALPEEDAAYFHAQFRRRNPLTFGEDYTILEGVKGRGHFAGCYMAWQQNNKGWWGEGEIKMFIDGDDEFPSYCGTGTEDYFGGAWGFRSEFFSAPYLGYIEGDHEHKAGSRHGMYRFHIQDPINFQEDLRVTMQAIGWRSEGRYLPLQDDIASVAYWYQTLPTAPFSVLPDRNGLEII